MTTTKPIMNFCAGAVIAAALIAFAPAAEAKPACVLAGGQATMVTPDLARFMAHAALNNQTIELSKISDQKQDRFVVFPALQSSDARNCVGIERIGSQPIERVSAERDYFVQFVSILVFFKLGASSTFASNPETYGLTTAYDEAK